MNSFLKKIFKCKKTDIKIIVAVDLNNGIGKDNDLLFSIKEDMKHFTEKTTDGVVIMGSKTYESIPKKFRPLKNRINIILSRNENKEYPNEDVLIKTSLNSAITKAKKLKKNIWIIGGASIYKQALSYVKEIELTQIFTEKNADTFFPEFKDKFKLIKESEKMFNEKEKVEFQFQTWARK